MLREYKAENANLMRTTRTLSVNKLTLVSQVVSQVVSDYIARDNRASTNVQLVALYRHY
jgi:hypothetical protein